MFDTVADLVVYRLLRLGPGRLTETLHFFVYDLLQILALLFSLGLVVGLVTTFLPKKRSKELLASTTAGAKWAQYPMAALLGAVTPFCSPVKRYPHDRCVGLMLDAVLA